MARGGWFLLARGLFIVPDAQVRVLDLRYQLYVYELFHRRAPSRLAHGVAIPLGVSAAYGALWAMGPGWAAAGALVLAGFHAAVATRQRLFGFLPVLLVAHAALLGAGVWLISPLGAASSAALVGACAVAQYLSHAPEPVPSPWSTSGRFTPVARWAREAGLLRIALVSACGPVHAALELVSGPRNLLLLLLSAAWACGYRPPSLGRLRAEVSAALSAPRVPLSPGELEAAIGGARWPEALTRPDASSPWR